MSGPSSSDELRIAGFGACIISGYPFDGAGFFEIACKLVEDALLRSVRTKSVSLGGFPAPRAEKYLKSRVFDFKPDYVVIQFGATDPQCPIRNKNRSAAKRQSGSSARQSSVPSSGSIYYHSKSTDALSPLRWEMASIIGYIYQIEPITPLPAYTSAIERMVCECQTAGITPVILSPFVYGSRYPMRYATTYTKALHQLRSQVPSMILIDALCLLQGLPKSQILMHDGFHLSRAGHQVVGEAIASSIVADVAAE
jgi:hypothetical protein